MFTKTSLFVSIALLLVCVVAAVTVLSSITPSSAESTPNQNINTGVAAIPALNKVDGLLTTLDVTRYLDKMGFIGGPTLNRSAPTVKNIKLTNITDLNNLDHIAIPGVSGKQPVYYTMLQGPFNLLPNLPTSALDTLMPGASNLPVLGNLPTLNSLPGLTGQELTSLTSGSLGKASKMGGTDSFSNLKSADTVLSNAYEVFNAYNGNLLAWG